jgi:hypothetical protein
MTVAEFCRRLAASTLAPSLGLALCAVRAEAQVGTSGDPHPVPRISSVVTVDGVIEDVEWNEPLTLELRYEISPGENTVPPVRTVVFLAYNEHTVLVAVRAYDPDPSTIRARYRDRDTIMSDDNVAITLDTFNDERRAYEFWVNPLGAQLDAIYNDVEKNFDRSWDAIWQFNTRTFVRAIVQYTDVRRNPDLYEDEVAGLDRDFFVQLLLSYKVNPQTLAFLGYSEGGRRTDEIVMTTTGRAVFAKISYAWLW